MAQIVLKIKLDIPGLQAELDKAIVEIKQKLSQFGTVDLKADTRGARDGVDSLGKGIDGVTTKAHETRSALAQWGMVLSGIVSAVNLVQSTLAKLKAPVDVASQFEQYNVQLEVLLGSADAAQKRIGELTEFAIPTPFEFPEVVRASNQLEVLTKGALSTGAGLRMVGDVASGTSQAIDELSTWFGRLYDGIQSGRPVGEAMQRLQELGAVSGDVRARIESMQKTNAKGSEVWAVVTEAMSRYNGMMDKQSGTFKGMVSNAEDSITAVQNKIGTALLPSLKDAVGSFISLTSWINTHTSTLAAMLPVVGTIAAAVIVYTNAQKAQLFVEALSIRSITQNALVLAIKNTMMNVGRSITDLATASTLAYSVVLDLVTGKITLASAATQLWTLATMSLAAVLTVVSTVLLAFGALWGIYTMTAGAAREESADLAYQTERVKLGLDNLQSTLDSMSFDQLTNGVMESELILKSLENRLRSLKEQTGTGIAALDWLGTFGGSEKIYDEIAATESLIKARKELTDAEKKQKEKIEDSIKYTGSLTKENVSQIKSLAQLEVAINKITLARKYSESDSGRNEAARWLKELEALKDKFKVETDEEEKAAKAKKELAFDLAKAKVEAIKDGKQKESAQLELWYAQELDKQKGDAQRRLLVDQQYKVKKKVLEDKFAADEFVSSNERERRYIDLQKDSLVKSIALIDNEFKLKNEKAKNNADELALLEEEKIAKIAKATADYNKKELDADLSIREKKIQIQKDGIQKELDLLDLQMQKELAAVNYFGLEKYGIFAFYEKKKMDLLSKNADESKQKEQEKIKDLSSAYERHFGALVSMAENSTTSQMSFDKQLKAYLLRTLKDYLVKYIAEKVAEATIFSTTETTKTGALATSTAAQAGISTAATVASTAKTVTSMGTIAAASAPAAVGTAIATAGASAWAGYAAVAAVFGLILGMILGKKEGGYTGKGNPNETAGTVHKEEYVFEADLVKGNVSKFDMLRQLLRSGVSIDQLYKNLSNQVNPVQLMPDVVLRTNLASSALRSGAMDSTSLELKSVLSEMKSVLADLKKDGVKANVEFEPIKGEYERRGADVFYQYEIQKKKENKRTA